MSFLISSILYTLFYYFPISFSVTSKNKSNYIQQRQPVAWAYRKPSNIEASGECEPAWTSVRVTCFQRARDQADRRAQQITSHSTPPSISPQPASRLSAPAAGATIYNIVGGICCDCTNGIYGNLLTTRYGNASVPSPHLPPFKVIQRYLPVTISKRNP